MSTLIRRSIAVGGGIAVTFAFFVWAFMAAGSAAHLFGVPIGVLESDLPPGDAVYRKHIGDLYTALSVAGLALCAGLSFALMVWDFGTRSWMGQAVFWVLLALAMPMAVLNYWGGDAFVSRTAQAGLNLVLMLLSIVCALQLFRVQTSTIAAEVLKGMALFFLLFQGAFLAAIYTVLWWLNWQGAISKAATESWSPGWITVVSAAASLFISVLQYRHSRKKEQDSFRKVTSKARRS